MLCTDWEIGESFRRWRREYGQKWESKFREKYEDQGVMAMARVPAYHTNSTEYPPEHRNVYHNYDDCKDGKRILPKHREIGNGGKPLCKECIRLG
jgi:hypothetical protein